MQLSSTVIRLPRGQRVRIEIRPGEVVRCLAGRVDLVDTNDHTTQVLPAGLTFFCRSATTLACVSSSRSSILEVRAASPEDRLGTRRWRIHSMEALLHQAREERREALDEIVSAILQKTRRFLGRLRQTATVRRARGKAAQAAKFPYRSAQEDRA